MKTDFNHHFKWIFLFLGIFSFLLGGYFISLTGYSFTKNNRFITVKGSAEKEVKANLAIWKINFVSAGDSLKEVSQKLTKDKKKILQFLAKEGFAESEISTGEFYLSREIKGNTIYNPYSKTSHTNRPYFFNGSFVVNTPKIDLAMNSRSKMYSLISSDIMLSSDEVQYIFNKINAVKPFLLKKALMNAKNSALEFAKSSGESIGHIRKAHQGSVQILAKNTRSSSSWESSKSPDKIIRLVLTVDYNLT